ncbi:MAG: pitrilysin family protein [Phycisphaerales bacterium]|nr:pitrilysin family protein [Phycisphaerales bacterium]
MPVKHCEHVLPNGLRIAAEIDLEAHSAAMGFFVRTGARDESPEQMGVSHFLEHMMFKGTERRTAADVDREFDDLGARHNAWTSAEMTAFHVTCLPHVLVDAEDILSDILRPSLREDDFEDEKPVILEEIAMYADQPFWGLYEKTLERFYGDHRLSHRVLGTNETVTALTRDGMNEYFQTRYSADNTIVSLAGNIDFDAMVERIEGHCGHWKRTGAERTYDQLVPRESDFHDETDRIHQHYICMAAPAPSLQDDRRYAAGMLAHILGNYEGSRLYWALVETGIAEEAQCHFDPRDNTGEYLTWCSCAPGDAERCHETVLGEMQRILDDLTEEDLLRVRSLAATGLTLAGELASDRMQRLGRLLTSTGTYRPLEDELDAIQSVTIDDLRATAEAFPLKPIVTGHLAPAGE